MTENNQYYFTIEPGGEQSEVTVRDLTEERIEKHVEEYDFTTKSAALRHLIWMGLRSTIQNDPRDKTSEETQEEDSESIELKDFIPSDKENAIDVRDELLERIDDRLLEALRQDPDIEMDGWEVYCNEG